MRRFIIYPITALAVFIGVVFSFAQSASATDYGVNMTSACQLAGKSSAYLVASNVNGWRCSPGATGVNIQAWCNYAYAGSAAVYLSFNDPHSWRCRR